MFRLFGFDIKVNAGFVIFVGLIAMSYQNTFGLWLAGALTVFTLIHEFGHAIVARHFGAHASISLGFMAGYTSYSGGAAGQMTPSRRALISAAGPAVQILASTVVLVLMGINPLSRPGYSAGDAALAIWWAGPVIRLLNLIPVLPLDGGHLVENGLRGILKRPVTRPMAIASLVITIGAAAYMYVTGRQTFSFFIVFLIFTQLQLIQATSKKPVQQARF